MSEENKALVRRWLEEVLGRGGLGRAHEILAPGYVLHDPSFPLDVHGPGGAKLYAATYRAAFPDARFAVEEQVAEGETVATRWTARGTHLGEFLGVAPTGERIEAMGMDIVRLVGGEIAEHRGEFDAVGLLRQLGLIPPPGRPGDPGA